MEKLLLRPEEAAELIGIGRTKVFELMRTGQLESVRIGSSRRIPAFALLGYVERLRCDGGKKRTTFRRHSDRWADRSPLTQKAQYNWRQAEDGIHPITGDTERSAL